MQILCSSFPSDFCSFRPHHTHRAMSVERYIAASSHALLCSYSIDGILRLKCSCFQTLFTLNFDATRRLTEWTVLIAVVVAAKARRESSIESAVMRFKPKHFTGREFYISNHCLCSLECTQNFMGFPKSRSAISRCFKSARSRCIKSFSSAINLFEAALSVMTRFSVST